MESPLFKILIADNNPSNLSDLSRILSPEYEILTVSDPDTIIDTVHSQNPALILLNTHMSVPEFFAQLKASEITRSIPVIFISTPDNVQHYPTDFCRGAADYIIEPFHASIVKARIKIHLQIAEYIRTVENLCMMDPLTDLPNRRAFDKQLDVEWRRAMRDRTPISALMLDIDSFKYYNDKYGHAQGDILLHSIAVLLKSSLRRATDFISRWGGEEFFVLLSGVELPDAASMAERIRSAVQSMTVPDSNGNPTSVTISIGATATIPEMGSPCSQLLLYADKALYCAKNSGKNKVCCCPDR